MEGQPHVQVGADYYLSPVVATDKAAFIEHFADPEIAANLLAVPFPYTDADADAYLRMLESRQASPASVLAVRNGAGYLIGSIGIVGGPPPTGAHRAEFGYWLAKPYRGRGLMPQVIERFTAYAFGVLGSHRLFATPFVSNRASHRALEKAGFTREGLLKHYHRKNGAYLDAVLFARVDETAF